MSNSPIITLLSDLGTKDASGSMAKAILMRHVPDAIFVDISHHIARYNLQQAAYLLLSAYRHFPKGTIHLLLVDVFSGETPRMLLAEKEGFFFIAPDNGLLPLSFGTELEDTRLCMEFSKPYVFSEWIDAAGLVIGTLQNSNGKLPYQPCELKRVPHLLQPKATPYGVECNILYIDRYENIVLDITKAQFDEIVKNRPFKIKIMRLQDITTVRYNYNDVPHGDPLCRFNDAGFLEIALNHAQAATLLGLTSVDAANLRYQTIKIFF